MIQVNKEEKTAILERFPDVHIVRTMKHDSKRHHYYCEESPRVLHYLDRLRGVEEPRTKKYRNRRKEGVRYR